MPRDGNSSTEGALTLPHPFLSRLSPSADVGIAVYLSLTGVLSVAGNGVVLTVFSRKRSHLRPQELMAMNLAVCDFGYSLLGAPFLISSSLAHSWMWGHAGCVWYGVQGFVFGIGSLITTALISLDRCLKICSIRYGQWVERRHIGLLIVGVWLYTVTWALLPVFGFGSYGPEPFGTSCTIDWWRMRFSRTDRLYVCLIMTLCFGLSTLTIAGSYLAILIQVRRSGRSLAAIPSSAVTHFSKEMRLTKIAAVICSTFLLAWTPYVIVSLYSALGGIKGRSEGEGRGAGGFSNSTEQAESWSWGTEYGNWTSDSHWRTSPSYGSDAGLSSLPPEVSVIPALLAKSHCVINPFIYQAMSKEFRADVSDLLLGGRRRRKRRIRSRGREGREESGSERAGVGGAAPTLGPGWQTGRGRE
ncbi:opsin 9 isoform X2 [Lepisosteus oculatus]|uniref:opsin 9 isoform X2 n=1 Tax=Lepisosteus oculatus TaxID=7918 RepID=UPI0035F50F7F